MVSQVYINKDVVMAKGKKYANKVSFEIYNAIDEVMSQNEHKTAKMFFGRKYRLMWTFDYRRSRHKTVRVRGSFRRLCVFDGRAMIFLNVFNKSDYFGFGAYHINRMRNIKINGQPVIIPSINGKRSS